MRILFEPEKLNPDNPGYVTFATFINGDHCGELGMSEGQFTDLCAIMLAGCKDSYDEFATLPIK